MVTKSLFTLLICLLALQRLWELNKSQTHVKRLLQQGGREHGAEHFPFMALLHGCWLVAMVVEVFVFDRQFNPVLASFALVLFVSGQILRILAMRALGGRWTARIITVPGLPPVTHALFRYVRHPNYIGVVLEIASAPLIHSAYLSSIIFSLLNLWLLKVRIAAEEKALNVDNNYYAAFNITR